MVELKVISYILFMSIGGLYIGLSLDPILPTIQHIKDPTKCVTVCHPPGYDGSWPKEFPDDVRKVMCEGEYCAKAEHGHPPGEEDTKCKAHYTCTVHCSEVCCVCLRECI